MGAGMVAVWGSNSRDAGWDRRTRIAREKERDWEEKSVIQANNHSENGTPNPQPLPSSRECSRGGQRCP